MSEFVEQWAQETVENWKRVKQLERENAALLERLAYYQRCTVARALRDDLDRAGWKGVSVEGDLLFVWFGGEKYRLTITEQHREEMGS